LLGRRVDVDLLEAVDPALLEQRRMRLVVRLDLGGDRLGRTRADLVEVGARDDLAPRRLDVLDDARVTVELLVGGLLQGDLPGRSGARGLRDWPTPPARAEPGGAASSGK
jgi:hypothetical protein